MDVPHALDPPYTAMPTALGQVIEPPPPMADQELPLYPHNTKVEPPPVEQSVEETPSLTVTTAPLPNEIQRQLSDGSDRRDTKGRDSTTAEGLTKGARGRENHREDEQYLFHGIPDACRGAAVIPVKVGLPL
jgi:hypothetical protein